MAQTDRPLADVRVAGGEFIRSLDLPAAVGAAPSGAASPGMLTAEERVLLSETVRCTWRGEGAIVDGGSFLGSSLMAEAQGLVASPALAGIAAERFPSGKPIHGYELGQHPAPANPEAPRYRRYGEIEYALGESFVPLLEQVIAPHRHLIELHIGDLTEKRWDGSPIEIAFIDVCKTPELNAHVARQFYPALIGGGSTLIHQDFFFDRLPWIRVSMGYLAEYVRWEGQVASSAVYEVVRSIPEDVAAYDPFTAGTLEECLTYHDAVDFPGIDRTAQLLLALSRVHLIHHRGPHEQALAELERVAVEYVDILGSMSRDESYQPTTGTPDSMAPRYRMDRAVAEVLHGADPAPRTRPRSPTAAPPREVARATAALRRRDWGEARARPWGRCWNRAPGAPHRCCSRASSSSRATTMRRPHSSTSCWRDARATTGPERCGPASTWSRESMTKPATRPSSRCRAHPAWSPHAGSSSTSRWPNGCARRTARTPADLVTEPISRERAPLRPAAAASTRPSVRRTA